MTALLFSEATAVFRLVLGRARFFPQSSVNGTTIKRHKENHSQTKRLFTDKSCMTHAGVREKSALGHGAESPSQVHYEKVICKSAFVCWETTSTDLSL